MAGAAGAAPIGSKKAFVLPTCCGTVVLNNANGNSDNQNALWAPAHFLGSNKVFTPVALNYSVTFAPPGGPSQTQTVNVAKGPVKNQPLTTCTFDFSQTDAGGSFHLVGSATGFIH